jgi:hypothetical protein
MCPPVGADGAAEFARRDTDVAPVGGWFGGDVGDVSVLFKTTVHNDARLASGKAGRKYHQYCYSNKAVSFHHRILIFSSGSEKPLLYRLLLEVEYVIIGAVQAVKTGGYQDVRLGVVRTADSRDVFILCFIIEHSNTVRVCY